MALGCAVATQARAESWFQFEVGVGVSSYTRQGPGIYYSPGFPYSAPVIAPAFRVGLVATPIEAAPHSWKPGLRLHATYINFGRVSWSATSPQDAADFSQHGLVGGYEPSIKGCLNNNCGQMSDFQSYGRIQALALTVEPYWALSGGWTFGLEAGPALYRTTWTTHATVETPGWKLGAPGTVHLLSTSPAPRVGLITGASISKGAFSIRYNYIFAPRPGGPGDNEQVPGVKGAHLVTMNYTF